MLLSSILILVYRIKNPQDLIRKSACETETAKKSAFRISGRIRQQNNNAGHISVAVREHQGWFDGREKLNVYARTIYHIHPFFYKNHAYKNVEAQITPKIKNIVVILLVAISISFPASDEI